MFIAVNASKESRFVRSAMSILRSEKFSEEAIKHFAPPEQKHLEGSTLTGNFH